MRYELVYLVWFPLLREERSNNTLYQELSFQESLLEDNSEITGKTQNFANHTYKYQLISIDFRQVIGFIQANLHHQVCRVGYSSC